MKKLLQRLFIALAVAALPIYAIADYTATQGAGTTVFAFVCFVSKVCPTHTNVTSTGTEIFTLAVPGQVQLSASNVGITGTVAATQSGNWSFQPGNVTITNTAGTPVIITGTNLAQESNGNLASILTAIQAAIPAGTNSIGSVTSTNVAQVFGGWTNMTIANTAIEGANAIKASAGQLAKLYCYNPNASVAYVQVFNTASGSVTLGTTKPSGVLL